MTPEKRAEYTANQRAKRQRLRTKKLTIPKLDALDRKALLTLPAMRAAAELGAFPLRSSMLEPL